MNPLTGIAHISRAHLVHLGSKDHRDPLVIKEKLGIQETQVWQVKMENLVNLADQEYLVTEEKQETTYIRNVH